MEPANDPSIYVALTSDDIEFGRADKLRELHTWHRRWDIPTTWFVTPFPAGRAHGIAGDDDLVGAMADAVGAGDECALHGCEHLPFEWGYPEVAGAMEFDRRLCESFADRRYQWERMHRPREMRARLEAAMAQWQAATGAMPRGFRSGWGSFSGTLYRLLGDCGFEWSSLRFASRSSWLRCMGREAETVINPHVGLLPYRQGDVIEYPILGDYGFHCRPAQVPELLALFETQFAACVEAGAPVVLVHHWHGLEAGGSRAGFDVYARILDLLCANPRVVFVTMSELHRRWGAQAVAPPGGEVPEP